MSRIGPFMLVVCATFALVGSGCARMSTDYGKSKGSSGRSSLNGFGALRQSYAQAGFRTRDVSRLSDRVMRTNVIVWTPQVLTSVDPKVTRWFERWLTRGNRTLVYIVPDSGSEADYWTDAARLAPPPQRLEYRRRAAKSVNTRMMWRLNRVQVHSNGWFRVEPLVQRKPIGKFNGSWQDEFDEVAVDQSEVGVEYHVVAYEKDKPGAAAGTTQFASGPTGPSSPNWGISNPTEATRTPITYAALVQTESGKPFVAEISSRRWNNSRIIVVAGGSLLTNYAFTRPFNRRLAEQIIKHSTPPLSSSPSAGFLTSTWGQIPVSEQKPGVPQASGMELLTVWPMSLVTMHGVMLGLVICLMLLPIFGRPRRIRRAATNDFGHHLDAVAALMNKTGGEAYARTRISEYMKRMHGETSGPWVLPDRPEPVPASAALPAATAPGQPRTLTPKRLTSQRPTSQPTQTPSSGNQGGTETPPVEDATRQTNNQQSDNPEAER